MLNDEAKKDLDAAQATGASETLNEKPEQEETRKGNWREVFRTAFERARRQQKPAEGRQELGRDKSKSLVLAGGSGRGVASAVLRHLFQPQEAHPASRRNPAWASQPGTQGDSRAGKQRSQQNSDSDAECGCSFHRPRVDRPCDARRCRPHFTNWHCRSHHPSRIRPPQRRTTPRIMPWAKSISLTLW